MRPEMQSLFENSTTYRELSTTIKQQSAYWRAHLLLMKREQGRPVAEPRPAYAPRMRAAQPVVADAAPLRGVAFEVTDAQWARIAPLLDHPPRRGRPPANQRQTLNGILYVARHHAPWRRIPARYGSYVTCWRRYLHWQNAGTWRRIQAILDLPDITLLP